MCDIRRNPDAGITERGIRPAMSSILVPFEFTHKPAALDVQADALGEKFRQLLSLVYVIFEQQPMRRFCWAISLSRSQHFEDRHIARVRRHSLRHLAFRSEESSVA